MVKVVYIAGASYSGSTLLGLLLGSQANTVFVGELKQFWRPPDRRVRAHLFCTCGLAYEECPFWRRVRTLSPSSADADLLPGLHWRNLLFYARLLVPLPLERPKPNAHGALARAIHQTAAENGSHVQHIVDSSKSIWTLDRLVLSGDVEICVIHLVRDGLGILDSLKRRGIGKWRGMARWAGVNLLLQLYLWRRGLPQLRLDYEALCLDTGEQFRRLNAFLETGLSPECLVDDVRSTVYHVFRGNRVRDSVREFAGVRYRQTSPASGWRDGLPVTLIALPVSWLLRRGRRT